jgi:hypothetical protein
LRLETFSPKARKGKGFGSCTWSSRRPFIQINFLCFLYNRSLGANLGGKEGGLGFWCKVYSDSRFNRRLTIYTYYKSIMQTRNSLHGLISKKAG